MVGLDFFSSFFLPFMNTKDMRRISIDEPNWYRTDGISVMRAGAKEITLHGAINDESGRRKLGNAFPEELKINKTLETLYVERGEFSRECIELYASALEVNRTLKVIGFIDCDLNQTDLEILFEALKKNNTLTTLVLGDHKKVGPLAHTMGDFIRSNETLKEIKLVNYSDHSNTIAPKDDHETREPIVDALEVNTTLIHFVFSCDIAIDQQLFSLNSHEMEKVKKYLDRNKAMKEKLTFRGCSLKDENIEALVARLKKDATLTTLDLSGSQIGIIGIKAIADLIRNNQTLKEIKLLDVSDLHMDLTKGKKAIIDALEVNTTLTEFIFSAFNPLEKNTVEKYLARNREHGEKQIPPVQNINACHAYKKLNEKAQEAIGPDPLAAKFNFFSGK